jgi:hypothetical protein
MVVSVLVTVVVHAWWCGVVSVVVHDGGGACGCCADLQGSSGNRECLQVAIASVPITTDTPGRCASHAMSTVFPHSGTRTASDGRIFAAYLHEECTIVSACVGV